VRRILASTIIALIIIPFIAIAVEAQASTIYYFDAVAGYYYIVKGNFDAFYIDENGNRYWIQTYQWDIDSSYTILRSPVSGRIYLVPSTSTKPILLTTSWFRANINLGFNPTITITIFVPCTMVNNENCNSESKCFHKRKLQLQRLGLWLGTQPH